MNDTEIRKGLAGVVVDTTAISKVNPETNSLLYRGYPVQELAATQPFEAVAYLLWHGELPSGEQLAEFELLEGSLRPLDPRTLALLDTLPVTAHPMDIVRTVVSQLGAFDDTLHRPGGWTDPELDLGRAAYLFAQLPTIVAAVQRRRRGLEPIPPRDDLDYSRNFLWMTFGELPSDAAVDVFRVSMVLYAEHSFNASTFTARVIASTTSDLYSAVVGAIGALKGPLHGGANEAVLRMLRRIGTKENIPDFIKGVKNGEERLMGFGHRVYKNYDPRAKIMQKMCHKVLAETGHQNDPLLHVAMELEKIALSDDYFIQRKLYPNIDFYSGITLKAMGFPTSMFTVLFAVARTVGWIAQWKEMIEDPRQKIGRPRQLYTGSAERDYVPIAKR